jgi:hypothetical protein
MKAYAAGTGRRWITAIAGQAFALGISTLLTGFHGPWVKRSRVKKEKRSDGTFPPQFGVSKDNNLIAKTKIWNNPDNQTSWERLLQSKSDITLFTVS